MTKPRRIQIDIGGIRERLEQIADREKRSLASLCLVLIEEALEARGKSTGASPPASAKPKPALENLPSIAQLVQGWDLEQLSTVSRIKVTRLEELANGDKPTEQELIYLGRHLCRPDGTLYQTEALMDICDRDFPNNHPEGKPIINGT